MCRLSWFEISAQRQTIQSQTWFLTVCPGKCYNSTHNYATPSSFHVLSNSLVTSNCIIQAITIKLSLHMPWMHAEEWTKSSTHTPQHQMGVSGQLYAPVDLPPGEVAQYLLNGRMSGPHNEHGWFGEQKTCFLLLGIKLWFISHPI